MSYVPLGGGWGGIYGFTFLRGRAGAVIAAAAAEVLGSFFFCSPSDWLLPRIGVEGGGRGVDDGGARGVWWVWCGG